MTTSPCPPATPHVCDVVIARTGGLAPGRLMALAQEKSWALVDEVRELEAERAAVAAAAADLLYAVVPTLDERDRRRAVVRLRRDIHNNRCTDRTRKDVEAVLPVLPDAARDACGNWWELTGVLAERRERAEKTLRDELDASWRRMTDLLADPRMRAALALASPEFIRSRLPERAGPEQRSARTVASYLTRAAVKTSPFSFLTSVAPLRFGAVEPLSSTEDRVSCGATPLAVELLLSTARLPGLAARLTLRVNPALREQADGSVLGLLPFRACADGFFCGDDEAQYLSGLAARAVRHREGPRVGVGEWAARLGAPETAVIRLIRTGILQPVTPWAPDSPTPLGALAGFLDDAAPAGLDGDSRERDFRTALSDAAGAERAVTELDASGRVLAVERLRTAGGRALAATGAFVPDWLATAPLVHETVRGVGSALQAADTVREDMERLRDILATDVVRSRFYDRLVDAFVAFYGPGGREPDLLSFVLKVVRHPALAATITETARQDRARTDGDRPDGFGTLAPATATVLFQVASSSYEAVRAGRHLTVLNRLNAGPGALLTRWLVAPGVYDVIGDDLSCWLRRLTPSAEPLQTAAWTDWAPVQYLDGRLAPRLQWPTALPGAGDHMDVALADLGLRHDPASGTLQAYRRKDGRTVSFPYLGSVPRHLIGGAHRIVMTLTDPWVVRARVNGEHHTGDPEPMPTHDVVRTPRRTDGRLVLGRAMWRLPRRLLPEPVRDEPPADYLVRLRTWSAEYGLPRRFYLRQAAHLKLAHSKPAWVDLADLYSVHAAFRSLAVDAHEVEIVEALPDMTDYMPDAGDGEARAVELTAALALGEGR